MAERRRKRDKNFLVQGSILAFAGVITKIIGAVYRIPLTNTVGTEGMGYYNVAFSIYTIALMLTSYSLPLAVSKLVSARVAVGQYRNAFKVFKCAMMFAVVASGVVSLAIFFGAEFIADTLMSMDLSVYALRVLAPCIFVVALLGVIRGFFQGNGSMMPTAFSQVIEQIVNAVASIVGAYLLLKTGMEVAKTRGDDSYGPAYAAAGGTVGTIMGAFVALLFVFVVFIAYYQLFRKKMRRDKSRKRESYQKIYRVLFLTIAPVILSATVYNISDFLDTAIFNNVPLSVATALAASLIPSLVATVQTGSRKQVHNKINTAIRFNMMIAIPCAVGLTILAKPLMDLLFYTEDNTTAALMLQLGAVSVVFFCPSTLTNSVLQGLDDMMTPVKNSSIALAVHVVSLLVMLIAFKWNIYAVVMSRTVFAATVYMLNCHALRERIGYVQERKRTFIIPTVASGIMGAVAVIVHLLFELFAGTRIATIFALLAAVPAYGIALVLLGGVTEEEIEGMPKGAALLTLCRKMHLFRDVYH